MTRGCPGIIPERRVEVARQAPRVRGRAEKERAHGGRRPKNGEARHGGTSGLAERHRPLALGCSPSISRGPGKR